MFEAFDRSASGLWAQRVRLNTIAGNLANVNTTRDAQGRTNPYRRKFAVFMANAVDARQAVRVAGIREDQSPFRMKFEPNHPDAAKTGKWAGYVRYPNIEMMTEYVDAMEATRAYEANVAAMEASKSMLHSALRLLA
jgi:flagellar basal-body rod protein FlgC